MELLTVFLGALASGAAGGFFAPLLKERLSVKPLKIDYPTSIARLNAGNAIKIQNPNNSSATIHNFVLTWFINGKEKQRWEWDHMRFISESNRDFRLMNAEDNTNLRWKATIGPHDLYLLKLHLETSFQNKLGLHGRDEQTNQKLVLQFVSNISKSRIRHHKESFVYTIEIPLSADS